MNTLFSIVIPTYNEEKNIGILLNSIKKNTSHYSTEIVIIDSGSTDNTLEIVKNYKLQIKNSTLLQQSHGGPGPARNLGAKHASGKILVFVDSDMTFAPDFIENLVKPIEEGRANGTFSKLEFVANPENTWSRCWGVNEHWVKGARHPANYPNKQKVFRAILKSEFDSVEGFSPTGEYTDDWTLSEKLGYLADNAPGAIFYHKNPDTLSEVFKQARWIGKRPYKFGVVGSVFALMRASIPVSLILGLWKAAKNAKLPFVVFKIVYDFGIFVGITSSLLGGKSAK
jgi:glycosyltransferase involved in cell wall biosynthesis